MENNEILDITLRPRSLREFIGQKKLKRILKFL